MLVAVQIDYRQLSAGPPESSDNADSPRIGLRPIARQRGRRSETVVAGWALQFSARRTQQAHLVLYLAHRLAGQQLWPVRHEPP